MGYVICPQILDQAGKNPDSKSSEVLLIFMCESLGFKIYIDKESLLIREYKKMLSNKNIDNAVVELFSTFLERKLMQSNEDRVKPLKIGLFNGTTKELVIAISEHATKRIIVQDNSDYNTLDTGGITLLEPVEFLKAPPTTHIKVEGGARDIYSESKITGR